MPAVAPVLAFANALALCAQPQHSGRLFRNARLAVCLPNPLALEVKKRRHGIGLSSRRENGVGYDDNALGGGFLMASPKSLNSGAIVLHVTRNTAVLLPTNDGGRARAPAWGIRRAELRRAVHHWSRRCRYFSLKAPCRRTLIREHGVCALVVQKKSKTRHKRTPQVEKLIEQRCASVTDCERNRPLIPNKVLRWRPIDDQPPAQSVSSEIADN